MTALRAPRVGLTTLALAASGSTTLLFNIVLARRLSVEDFGEVARSYGIALGVAQITMAAVAPAIAWRVAQEPSDAGRRSLARASLPILATATAAASFLFPVAVLAGLTPSREAFAAGGWLFTLVYPTYFGLKMLLFVLDRARLYAGLELASDVVFAACLLILAVVAPSDGLLAFSIAYGAFVVAAVWVIRVQADRGSRRRFTVDRRALLYGALGGAATYSSVARFPLAVVITGAVAGSIVAGQVGAVIALTMPFFLVPQAAGILTFAGVARSDEATHLLVRQGVRAAAAGSAALVSAAIVLAPIVIPRLLGDHYAETVGPFTVLIACLVPQLIATPVGNALAGEGAVGLSAAISGGGLAVALAAVASGAAAAGLAGAVIGLSISAAATGCWLLSVGTARYRTRPADFAAVAVVPVALALSARLPSASSAVVVAILLATVGLLIGTPGLASWPRRLGRPAAASLPMLLVWTLSILLGFAAAVSPGAAAGVLVLGLASIVAWSRPAECVLGLLVVKPLIDYWVRLKIGPSSAGQLWGAAVLVCALLYLLRGGRASGSWRAPPIFLVAYPLLALLRDHSSQFLVNELRLATWLAIVMVVERYATDAGRQLDVVRAGLAAALLLVAVVAVAIAQHHYGSAYYASTTAFAQLHVQQPSGLAASAVFCGAIVLLPIYAHRRPLLWLAVIGLITAAIVASLVRASFVALGILITVFVARGLYRRRASLLAAAFGVGVALIVATALYAGVISERLSRAAPRLSYWQPVLGSTLHDAGGVLVGRGPTSSFEVIQQALGLRIWSHNDFVELFATGGVLLLAAFCGLVIWLFGSCRKLAASQAHSADAREVGVIGIGACAAWIAVSLLDGAVFASCTFFFALLIGLVRAMATTPHRTWIDLPGRPAVDRQPVSKPRASLEPA